MNNNGINHGSDFYPLIVLACVNTVCMWRTSMFLWMLYVCVGVTCLLLLIKIPKS